MTLLATVRLKNVRSGDVRTDQSWASVSAGASTGRSCAVGRAEAVGAVLDVGAGARASAAGARRAGAVGAVQKRSMGVIFTGHLGGGRPCPASRMAQRRDRFKWGKCACRRHFVGAVHRIGGADGLGVRWLGRNNRRTFQASLPDSSYNMYYVKFQKGRWKFGSLRRSPVPVSGGPPSPGPGTVPIGPLPPPSAGPGHLGLRRPSSRSVPGDRVQPVGVNARTRTRAVPVPSIPNLWAAAYETSMRRPSWNGPRSFTRTTTLRPLSRLVIST